MSQTRSLIIHFLIAMVVSALAIAISIHSHSAILDYIYGPNMGPFSLESVGKGWILILSGGLLFFFARIKISQIKNPHTKKTRASLWLLLPIMLIGALTGSFLALRGYAAFHSKFEQYITERLLHSQYEIEAISLSLIASKTGFDRSMEKYYGGYGCQFSPISLRILLISRNVDKDRMLLPVIRRGDIEKAKILLAHGADINGREDCKESHNVDSCLSNTMLMKAALYANNSDSAEMVKLLLDNGADPKLTNDDGATALHFVSNPQAATLLLKAGIDINTRDKNGETPLHYLIDRTFDISCDNNSESRSDWCEISQQLIKYLIATGADINAQDADGRTPLYKAVENGFAFRSFNAIKILLESGANPNLPNKKGITPLKLAYQDKLDKETIKLLIAHGAKLNP